MKFYNISKTTILIREELAARLDENNINDFSNFIFQNLNDYNCMDEFSHTANDLKNYIKEKK